MGADFPKTAINQKIRKARANLSTVCGADHHILERKINRIAHRRPGSEHERATPSYLEKLEKEIEASAEKRIWRQQHRPATAYPGAKLPIMAKKEEIVAAITAHQVIIIAGETGSGKTTQIPKFCLDAGRGIDGVIGCTQPRRIAATTVARRIAEELNQPLGQAVGYKIRFRDKTAPDGFIKIMTDGILLAEIQADPYLNQYDTLVVDEAHERSLNIDLTLGIVKRLLSQRQDLKLIVTSATIDTEKFSRAFDQAPIIEVSGRMYPVQVRYEPPSNNDELDASLAELATGAVKRLIKNQRHGDILIFMPSEQDIRDTCQLLDKKCGADTTVFPLFARLSASEQTRVFSKVSGRKIIVATNVAETSITIPGIKYVVDTGLARIPRYTPRSRCTLLPIDPISRSSADQRKGRCGRVADGICIRLYSEEDYLARPLFTPPEILRANLAAVILQMIALKLGSVADFPFIDPPPPKSVKDGHQLLLELGAIALSNPKKRQAGRQHYRLTAHGRLMSRLPIDPRLARILIEANRRGCLDDITIIAAALSIQDPRERPLEAQKAADQVHARWVDPGSDFATLLNIWRRFEAELAAGTSQRKLKQFCRDHYLSYRRMREWKDIHRQLLITLKESSLHYGPSPASDRPSKKTDGDFSRRYSAVHQSIVSGFLSNIACRKEKNLYLAAREREVMIFPGSGLFNQAGKWIVAADMVLTSRLFARTVARIDPNWLESMAPDRCRYTHANPHWDREKETVMATEQVTLFGLIIVPRRPVVYGRIDADKASDIFLESALVENDLKQPLPFMRHNQKLVDEILAMESRLRRRNLFIGNDALTAFYKHRLKGVWNTRLLKQKIKARGDDGFLRMEKEDLLRDQPDNSMLSRFPDTIRLGEGKYPCTYTYAPNEPADGVTVIIPVGAMATVPIFALDWLVPGMLEEKIKALVRGLPKSDRHRLGPIPQIIQTIVQEMPTKRSEPLINVLGQFLHQRFDIHLPAASWPMNTLPEYLKFRIVVKDHQGRKMISSRDPAVLHRRISSGINPREFNAQKKQWERHGITRWDFEAIPNVFELPLTGKGGPEESKSAGDIITAYPGLSVAQNKPNQVSLCLFQEWSEAIKAHVMGVKTLATLHLSQEMKQLKRRLTVSPKIVSKTTFFGGEAKVKQQLFEKVTANLFAKNIRTKKAFMACLDTAKRQLIQIQQAILAAVEPVINAYHCGRTQLADLQTRYRTTRSINDFIDCRLSDLNQLVPKNFIALYDVERLDALPLFIEAVTIRAQRGVVDLEKDRRKSDKIKPFGDQLGALLSSLSPGTSDSRRQAIESYFWLLEAFKVSVFAQELKVPGAISAQRLSEKLSEIDRMV